MLKETIFWSPAPAVLTLPKEEVHVWYTSLEQPASLVEELAEILSEDELARAKRFYFDQHRKRFIIARGLLRRILGRYLEIEPREVEFSYGRYGKPALIEKLNKDKKLDFNLSHSQDIALSGVTCDRAIGIDIEHLRPMNDAEQIAKRYFSEQENAVFQSLPIEQQQQAFFNAWTRKEAYLKACGDGITRPLNQVEVSLAPGEPAKILRIQGSPETAAQWSIQDFIPASGYRGAIAVGGQSGPITFFSSN